MTSQDENKFNNEGQHPFPKQQNREVDYSQTTNYFAQVDTEETSNSGSRVDLDGEEFIRDEEFAAEAIGANDYRRTHVDRETHMEGDVQAGWGWAAIILSLIALFNIWPLVMGIAGIVVGVMAKRRGADTLGNIAVVAGIAAIVIHLIIDMFV